ncbi:carbamoyltransferase [Nitrosococcus wardiae]|uniref:Carbamoyltransferase n=1 Tax=Nitrosococcus wardiae TaxID=1814290 RepID=A0A4P7C2Q8_9GAMM|nr:carbamoyltransferase C-terminal domain-containing protein [Nitrosococcus wardiae]QBQ55960.1 carbamoyltransferase [Nitrosococcus wardiae]
MLILGINAFHGDSSACILQGGALVAAAEEERFRRIKHWAGFPSEAIRYCLAEAGAVLGDVDHIAINTDPMANILKKVGYTLKNRPDLRFVLDRIKNKRERAGIDDELNAAFPDHPMKGKVHYIEHHLSHLASSHLVSPFDESVAVSVDGFGDFSSGAWGVGRDDRIEIDNRVFFPHSLGIFYQALTQFIGFPNYGDEYKVMGLAPYGKPAFMEQMRQIVLAQADGSYALNLDLFRHHKEKIEYEWASGSPVVGELFNDELIRLVGVPKRAKDQPLKQVHHDIAHSVQAMYEEAFFHLLNCLHERHGLEAVCLAGGCAMNSVANGKIRRKTPFKKVYIQSAAGDAGGAIGSAFVVHHQLGIKVKRNFVMDHAYWGPQFSNEEVAALLKEKKSELEAANCIVEGIAEEGELCRRTAEAIAGGKVVGWFQGRMEWGPRALGNRSIICDPRRTDMKDILNLKIKRRESFRPFAPSILREKVGEWFEEDDDVPFMMKVFQIREEKRALIPAVTHVDGSGRLQTVYRDTNRRYYRLIEAFHDLTGVPIVLNTSFNENEPVVCRPEEALDCFLRTKMDSLVMGQWYVARMAG